MDSAKLLGILALAAVAHLAVAMEYLGDDAFDPNALPPPAAGLPGNNRQAVYTCEEVIFGVSEDGVKYVRQSGGGTIYAAVSNGEIGYYELGQYDYMTRVDKSDIYPDIVEELQDSLLNCDAYPLPSAVRFST